MGKFDELGISNGSLNIGVGGVGFVVVPDESEREQYINDCYNTKRLTIYGGRGYSLFNNVPCPPNVLSNVKFPAKDEYGTPVVWIKDDISGLPVIVAYLSKEGDGYSINQNQFRVIRGNDSTREVDLFIDGDESVLQINVLGDSGKPAKVTLKVNSENADSIVDLYCDNQLNITSEKEVNINTSGSFNLTLYENGKETGNITFKVGEGLSYYDEFSNKIGVNKDEISFQSKKIVLGNGKQPLVLGNTLNDILSELIDTLSTMVMAVTMPTAVPSPPTIAKLTTIKGKLNGILSTLSNTD